MDPGSLPSALQSLLVVPSGPPLSAGAPPPLGCFPAIATLDGSPSKPPPHRIVTCQSSLGTQGRQKLLLISVSLALVRMWKCPFVD